MKECQHPHCAFLPRFEGVQSGVPACGLGLFFQVFRPSSLVDMRWWEVSAEGVSHCYTCQHPRGSPLQVFAQGASPWAPAVDRLIARANWFLSPSLSGGKARILRSIFYPSLGSTSLGTKVDMLMATVTLHEVSSANYFFKFWFCPFLWGLRPKSMGMAGRPLPCTKVGSFCVLPTSPPYLLLQICFQNSV